MNSSQSKVFGIGLSKTGTTSLARALEILGYNTRDYLGVTRYSPGDLTSIDLDEVNANDAFTDTPIPSFYRELDKMYPGSKFILTVRDMDGWLKSCKKQFTQKLADKQNEANINLFMDLYGCFVFDEEKDETSSFDNRDIANVGHGAGPQTAKTLFDLGPDVLITGNGPGGKAAAVLQQSSVAVYIGAGEMTVKEAYDAYKSGSLNKA